MFADTQLKIGDQPSFVAVLGDTFTTHSMDRRGFGASGDGDAYTIEIDFEDVRRVVDDVAARTGGDVAMFGHSYGANCALGGAALTGNVHHLVLYEPSFGLQYPPGSIEEMEAALARGENDRVMVAILTEFVGMTEAEIDTMRSSSVWPARLAAAHTIPRECRAEHDWIDTSGQFDAVTAPTLLLAGSETVASLAEVTPRVAAVTTRCADRGPRRAWSHGPQGGSGDGGVDPHGVRPRLSWKSSFVSRQTSSGRRLS